MRQRGFVQLLNWLRRPIRKKARVWYVRVLDEKQLHNHFAALRAADRLKDLDL
jgi:hypothetical protein